MTGVVFALGANLGEPFPTLCRALALLDAHEQWTLTAVSSIYRTDPVGGPPGQPDYLNAVGFADVEFGPRTLLGLFHVVEAACGRTRESRWGARTLDLDLLSYDGVVSNESELTLPHPRAHERAFVVQPWLEIDAAAALPGVGRLDRLPAAQVTAAVRRIPDLSLPQPLGATR
jgi:2-amino-4-hydroxy-6-hydroxymethyldihydropteridine diphosphokinase